MYEHFVNILRHYSKVFSITTIVHFVLALIHVLIVGLSMAYCHFLSLKWPYHDIQVQLHMDWRNINWLKVSFLKKHH